MKKKNSNSNTKEILSLKKILSINSPKMSKHEIKVILIFNNFIHKNKKNKKNIHII